MEKIGPDEVKGLEEEIDSAVDRLFVEKRSSAAESLPIGLPISEPPYEPVKASAQESSSPPSPEPLPFMKLFEKMETQLLSLEWEITKENIEKTKEEVLALRETLKKRPDITSLLNFMEKVLIHMTKNEGNIRPPQIKFLLDSKETLKLLMKKETGGEISTYKQLALGGIEARFLSLEGMEEKREQRPSLGPREEREKTEIPRMEEKIEQRPSLGLREEREKTGIPKMWEKQMEGILNKMNLFSERMDEILKKFDQYLDRLGQVSRTSPEELVEKRSLALDITIFKIGERLIGIESHKIFKLFKVPSIFRDKYSSQQKVRLKDFEFRMVDLKKIFPMETGGGKGEIQLVTVREEEEYKGLMVDQVLKKLSAPAEISGDYGEYFLGMFHWTYQEQEVKIPILNLKKI
jgi:chemotaxis protein histidine kinase CheA